MLGQIVIIIDQIIFRFRKVAIERRLTLDVVVLVGPGMINAVPRMGTIRRRSKSHIYY